MTSDTPGHDTLAPSKDQLSGQSKSEQNLPPRPEEQKHHDAESSEASRGSIGHPPAEATQVPQVELDDFGLPIRKREPRRAVSESRPGALSTAAANISGKEDGESQNSEMPMRATSLPVEGGESAQDGGNINKSIASLEESNREGSDTKFGQSSVVIKAPEAESADDSQNLKSKKSHKRTSTNLSGFVASEWSHQRLAEKGVHEDEGQDQGWKNMPALGPLDVYDDYGRMVARAAKEEEEKAGHHKIGAAGKGYTRVQEDDDAESVTSLDEDTSYLFKEPQTNGIGVEDDELRDPLSQMQATKDLLTEGQRIAYVGVTRLTIIQMVKDLESFQATKSTKKLLAQAVDSMTKWGQQTMIRLYSHMEIDSAEQVMIEQLAEHGVQPSDLVPPLMQNARVKNPLSEEPDASAPSDSPDSANCHDRNQSCASTTSVESSLPSSPPPYEDHANDDLPDVRMPSQLPSSTKLDIDLRWTVLCDLFLVLIANSTYDARSRRLLEKVGESMDISWLQICRFEKRVIDALEMQEEAAKETWDEAENMEKRRKMALKKRYMAMGLATVGGGLVIGLSAGLLAPVIGAGLAAGFTTIGVSGTGAFLGGVGGTALITSGATLTGGTIAVRASNRRTGAVRTFEYRPLHNNKRVNLIVTVAGWMTGGVDDVRLPYSTIDPIMGDIYSILWEPEMLQSMGATINILATEALTQGLQQVLGSTVLTALMASLQLPIVLTKLSYLIDNPWTVSLARANAAGLILADSIIDKNLGSRPITLVGFSLGSRVIFSCLKELAKNGEFGIVQNVYMFGSPNVANKDEYLTARSVVSGRFVNGYASNDWILGYLFRATSGGIMRVAGLAAVEGVPGVENVDVTHLVNGHMEYRAEMPRLLREVGWEVESDEFAELEDPDPEKHQERQRELIREIHEARKDAEAKPDKKKFGFFRRGKLAEKKGWETYEVDDNDKPSRNSMDGDVDPGGNVLFDIDAIREELASEQIQVKQLESTLPPMKLDLSSSSKGPTPDTASEISTNPKQSTSLEGRTQPVPPPVPSSTSQPSLKSATEDPAEGAHDLEHPNNNTWAPSHHNDEMQMTFDTSYTVPHARLSTGLAAPPSTISPMPDEKSNNSSNFSLTHNAWADDDHTNEKGINMTFE